MRRFFVLAVLLFAVRASAADCPFGIPIKTLAPHTVNGYSWGNVIRPQGDACISHVAVEPGNNAAWYAGGFNGLYMTKNHGLTWTKPLSGNVNALLLVPGDGITVPLVYVGISNRLYLSRDNGTNWALLKTFANHSVASIMVGGGKLYVGGGWGDHVNPSGIYVSNLGGGFMTFKPFGPGHTGLIVWNMSRNPSNGVIYAGTEIYDHPQPYHPPFFRSANDGGNWTNVGGGLPWHTLESAVRPGDGYLYALTEGAGLYGSTNSGSSWIPPTLSPGLGVSLLMDPQLPTRLYVGRHEFGTLNGGLFRSSDSGMTYIPIGLQDVTVADIALNGSGSRIYAALYGSGIYVSTVP